MTTKVKPTVEKWEELEQYKCVGMTCNHERSDEHYVIGDKDLKILLSHSVQEAKAEILKKMETDKVRKAKPADEYERGYDHGFDDCKKILLASLKQEEEKV